MILKLGLISKAHKLFLNAQRIHRHVNSNDFLIRLDKANNSQIKAISEAIGAGDLDAIKAIEADLMPVKQWHIKKLRHKARALHVKYWYNLSKDELIKAINET
jgi:hypothetical protein